MVKTEHHYSTSWESSHQQQGNYFTDIPTNVSLIINNTNQTSSIDPSETILSIATEKNLTSANEYNSTKHSNTKEIYPWMSEKKHGNNKNKQNSKNQSTNSNSSSSSPPGMINFS